MKTPTGRCVDLDWWTHNLAITSKVSSLSLQAFCEMVVFFVKAQVKSMHFLDCIRVNTLNNKDTAIICGHVWKPSKKAVYGDLFMVMDTPLGK